MATVYLARDLRHDRAVAIKVLLPELAAGVGAERFVREIALSARLQHPHIVPLIDSGERDGLLYYVMPLVDGESLRRRLDRDGRLPLPRALAVAREVGSALDYAHRHGVVHRDVKPENVLLADGGAIVADFGIALAVADARGTRLTATGLVVGTPAYMSPEQLTGEREPDPRTDQYALAAVLFEMLVGRPPYDAPTPRAMLAQRFTGPVPSVRAIRPQLPDALDAALRRAMALDPEERYPTVAAFVEACDAAAASVPRAKSRGASLLFGLALVALVGAASWWLWARLQREQAAASLPRIQRLAEAGAYAEAFALASAARRHIAGDPLLDSLWHLVSLRLVVRSDPPGATVLLERFSTGAADTAPPRELSGATPLGPLTLARGDYRVVVRAAGFAPVERIASTEALRTRRTYRPDSVVTLSLRLRAAGGVAPEMVPVPGGRYTLVSPDAPPGAEAELADYEIDRREVTNEEFREFVRAGGYAALAGRYADRTGLPAPRSWVNQDFPAGAGRHPVTDVSWQEAAAYCASRGKTLPTLHQWEKAARNGATARGDATSMPWGLAAPRQPAARRANFNGGGTMPVGSFPFGISPFGAHDMAGNVKEWTRTPAGRGYVVAGGSFEDPVYLFGQIGVYSGESAGRTIGFRCARGAAPAAPIDLGARTPAYRPVTSAGFRSLLAHYRYDRRPLDARVLERVVTPEWTRETIRYAGLHGGSVVAHLFLPPHAAPPYQTMVYVASSAAFQAAPVAQEAPHVLGPNIRAGRAVFAIVFDGMIGREHPPGHERPRPSSVGFRDQMVLHATELRLGLDYLATRPDVDTTRLAYVGLSWGAGSRLVLAGVDDRFRSVVLIGGGIDERLQPTLPEASNVNFAAHIRPPKLLLNGRNDEEHTWLARALPLWNLLREPKKLVLVDGAGHLPPLEVRGPAINAWLDETLGPVRGRR
jgi:formylglycine-generating enzyme required for sulfatase activity